MSFLSKIFGGSKTAAPEHTGPPPECHHGALVPRWNEAADMGKRDRISNYLCEGCQQEFTPAEAEAIRPLP
jgi:hypothetical protein